MEYDAMEKPDTGKKPPYSRRQMLKLIGASLAAGALSIVLPVRLKDSSNLSELQSNIPQGGFGFKEIDGRVHPPETKIQNHDERPNIILFIGDNHNATTMGCAGHPFIQTPGLDRLAREGLFFENAFSPTPLCSPSRASILTGNYAHNHGVLNNHTPWTRQRTTFLEMLSKEGYSTAFIGKWHMPGKELPEMPFLDLFISYTYREGQGAYFNCPLIVNGVEVPPKNTYITSEITDYAIDFIQQVQKTPEDQRKPFCVCLAHRPGHPPYQAPKDISGMYHDTDVKNILPDHINPWWYGKANRNLFEGIMMGSYYDQYRKYCETLTAMDRDIVRLLEYLDQNDLSQDTLVIYLGDNGMQWGTHNCHGIREPFEESIKLPFIVRAPGLIPDSGKHRQQMVLNIDLAPTLLQIAGASIPNELDGQSLVPILRGDREIGREAFLLEFWRYFPENTPSYNGIRTEGYKYIQFERGRRPWLFDLRKDPNEQTNLYNTADGRKILPELLAMIEQIQN